MGLSVFQNLAGTLRSAFRLGKNGPTLRQGANDPNVTNEAGNDGDVFIQYGATQSIYQRKNGHWFAVGEGTANPITRRSVTSSTYIASVNDQYLGVNYPGPVTIYLPDGVENMNIIIKDESGNANEVTAPIHIVPYNGQTIDGETEIIIRQGYVSLSLIYGAEWHLI
jgi:hypothetical protein